MKDKKTMRSILCMVTDKIKEKPEHKETLALEGTLRFPNLEMCQQTLWQLCHTSIIQAWSLT